jgi:isopropylmalate/homocitrate/citramalate synthase
MAERQTGESLYASPLSYTASSRLPDPRELKIYDSTLRDGEQMPGVAMSPEQKYRIAEELSTLGCHILDVGFPAVSESERRALQLILDGKSRGQIRDDVEILVMCRATSGDIDATVHAIRQIGYAASDVTFLIFTSASPLHVRHKLGPTLLRRERINPAAAQSVPFAVLHDANKRMVAEAMQYARFQGSSKNEFGSEDASRTPIDLLIDLVDSAVAAGADRYIFPDTTGSLSYESTSFYCGALTRRFPDIERASHFHNDFGLAAANVITGIRHGFTIFSTTVNGIGERAGNAAMHSVVAGLKYLYGLEIPNFQYDRLCHVKRVVEEITGIPVQAQEPVVGYNAFTHESGIHTHGVGIDRRMYEPIPYDEVGGTARYVYGKHSGLTRVCDLLAEHAGELGVAPDREFAARVLDEIKSVRERQADAGDCSFAIRDYYAKLARLGLSEDDVLHIAQEMGSFATAEGAA